MKRGALDFCCRVRRFLIQVCGMTFLRLPGSGSLLLSFAAAACLLSSACRAPIDETVEDRPLAIDTRPLSDVEVITLTNHSSLIDMEQKFGPGERQSRGRIAYRSAQSPDKFFWVYPYQSPEGGEKIHHIVLADKMEEKGKVVWPVKWKDMTPASAAFIHSKAQGY